MQNNNSLHTCPHRLPHTDVVKERRLLLLDTHVHDSNIGIVELVQHLTRAKVQVLKCGLVALRIETEQREIG